VQLIQKSQKAILFYPILLLPILINTYSIYAFIRDYKSLAIKRRIDSEFYAQISAAVPQGAPTFIEGKKQAYFECGLKSISNQKLSYSFVPSDCINYLLKDSTTILPYFYYVGPNINLSFEGYSKGYIDETTGAYTKHYIYYYKKLINS
jgi:hypothetical protein